MTQQYEKTHATTVIDAVDIQPHRFVSYGGGYASGAAGAGGLTDALGVSESEARVGEALSVVTGFSYLVEAGESIPAGQHVKPGTDGRAMIGTITDRCGIALGAAAAAGEVIEVRVLVHMHPVS